MGDTGIEPAVIQRQVPFDSIVHAGIHRPGSVLRLYSHPKGQQEAEDEGETDIQYIDQTISLRVSKYLTPERPIF